MHETFIDLDELIMLCRDKSAKKFIQEAVSCYRAGAYRSCIVSTWNAVVFDFIHKMRQLGQVGNGEAIQLLEEFENMNQERDVKKLWKFESDIPHLALNNFQLISPVEKADITRLFEDRNRCAHPSMASLENPFQATAELARYHMRSAVTHLLQRPPVQGRAALGRIWQDIKSDYFPIDPNLGAQYFQNGPLARARDSLIKDVIIGLTISLLTEDLPEEEVERQFSGLNAVAIMYPNKVREVLNEELSSIITGKVTDENWIKVVIYLRKVAAWENLSEPCRLKAIRFIEKLNVTQRIGWQDEEILTNAAYVDFLREAVKEKLREAPPDNVLDLEMLPDEMGSFVQDILKADIEAFVQEFAGVYNYDDANKNASKLYRYFPYLRENQKENVLMAFCENDQIHHSFNTPNTIKSLFKEDVKSSSCVSPYWISFRKNLDEYFPMSFDELKHFIDSYLQ